MMDLSKLVKSIHMLKSFGFSIPTPNTICGGVPVINPSQDGNRLVEENQQSKNIPYVISKNNQILGRTRVTSFNDIEILV